MEGYRMHPKAKKQFLLVHAVILILCLLFPLYKWLTGEVFPALSGCLLHDLFFLYCPMCGGTRAFEAIFRFDFLGAFACNSLVVFLIAVFLILDGIALYRLLKGREQVWCVPVWLWVLLGVSLVAYGVLRNYLMIAHGIDPLGDLGFFWRAIANK